MTSEESTNDICSRSHKQEQSSRISGAELQESSEPSEAVQRIGVEPGQRGSAREHHQQVTEENRSTLRDEPQAEQRSTQITKDCGYGLDEPLFQAIERNDLAKVKELINGGANVNLVTRVYGGCFFPLVFTPLILAAEGNRVEIFEALLRVQGVNVNQTDHFGSSVLHEASRLPMGSKMVELLLHREDIDVNLRNTRFGYTPLHDAAINHCTETMRLLLGRQNIEVNVKDKDDGFTPLHHAAIENQAAMVKLLIEKQGIDVNVRDNDPGSTPLVLASKFGFAEVVETLLAADGVDVNAQNSLDLSTALHEASKNGHEEVVKSLLEKKGIRVSVRNASGVTAYGEAVETGHPQIAELILAKRAMDSTLLSDLYERAAYWLHRTRRMLQL